MQSLGTRSNGGQAIYNAPEKATYTNGSIQLRPAAQ